ncbi:hypothetical protein NN561_007608 [Cricetulus griseus]
MRTGPSVPAPHLPQRMRTVPHRRQGAAADSAGPIARARGGSKAGRRVVKATAGETKTRKASPHAAGLARPPCLSPAPPSGPARILPPSRLPSSLPGGCVFAPSPPRILTERSWGEAAPRRQSRQGRMAED